MLVKPTPAQVLTIKTIIIRTSQITDLHRINRTPNKSAALGGVFSSMSGGRRPVSRMYRHEPASAALRAAAGQSTGIDCLRVRAEEKEARPRHEAAAPPSPVAAGAPAGISVGMRQSGRRHFERGGAAERECTALVTNVGSALDHGDDYRMQLQLNRMGPSSPSTPPDPPRSRPPSARPYPAGSRQPPPFAVDSTHNTSPRAREREMRVAGSRTKTVLESTREQQQREAGVPNRTSPERRHRLG